MSTMKDGIVNRSTTKTPSWAFVVTVDGKRKWFSGYPTRKAAKEARDEMRSRITRGEYIAPSKTTLGEWLTEWLEAPGEIEATTHDNYRRVARLYVQPHPVASIRLQTLKRSDLTKHWRTLAESGGKDGAPLSRATVQAARAVVSKALNAAVGDDRIRTNPATRSQLPSARVSESAHEDGAGKAWSGDELRALLSWSEDAGDRWHPLWLLMANTGLRPGEAVALRWDDVDLDGGRVRVWRASWRDTGNGRVGYKPTKTGRERSVPLPGHVAAGLRAWRTRQAQERLSAGPAWVQDPDAGDLVFTWQDGRGVRTDYASRAFGRTVKGAGVRALSLYSLRHTFATLLLRDRTPVHKVSRWLGHADATMTLNVYAHAVPGDEADDAAAIVRALGGGM